METRTLTELKRETTSKIEFATVRHRYETTPHVLSISSSLMGICFIVLTSLKVIGKAEATVIDEITGVAIVLFMGSCIFSSLSIRLINKKRKWMENVADISLLAGLSLLFITAMLFSFNVIK